MGRDQRQMKTVGVFVRGFGLIMFGISALFSVILDLAIVGCNFGAGAVILSILLMPFTAIAVPIFAISNEDYIPVILIGIMLASTAIYIIGEKME